MKKINILSLALAMGLIVSGCGGKTEGLTLLDNQALISQSFINNEKITNIGDPYLVEENGRYYVTATCDGRGYDIYSCDDLMSWKKEGRIFSSSAKEGWVRSSLWQPQLVIGDDGKYYLYYCGNNDKNSLRIGVAVADTITGPYKDVYDHPLVEFGVATIDPYLFKDDDGKMYLYFSRDCSENIIKGYNTSQIYVIEMADYVTIKEGAKAERLITPEQDWELLNGNFRWNEGPDMLKLDGKYYLFYSGGFYGDSTYSIGYAVSDSPMGPFAKYENNPVIASTDVTSGPGNNSFFLDKTGKELYNCYHTHTIKSIGGGNRKVTVDRCGFRSDGSFYMNGPTTTYQTPVLGSSNFTKLDVAGVSVTGAPADADLSVLTDGETLNSKNESLYEWSADKNDDLSISFSFSEKTDLNCIYIYGTKDATKTVASFDIIFDEGKIAGVSVPVNSEAPTVLYFNNVLTESVKIVPVDYGEASGFALSEVIFYNFADQVE